jgi:asparagine synthetase B (glutamine-hydrolysing)
LALTATRNRTSLLDMCGICGIVSNDASERINPRVVIRMRDMLGHRGSDDQGYHVGPGVALGHRRLSIIDLRSEGRRPMADEEDKHMTSGAESSWPPRSNQ